jgi:hypothetical protein
MTRIAIVGCPPIYATQESTAKSAQARHTKEPFSFYLSCFSQFNNVAAVDPSGQPYRPVGVQRCGYVMLQCPTVSEMCLYS